MRNVSAVERQNDHEPDTDLDLPESCISVILSFTTPRDVSRLAAVSKPFKSAADSDCVWNKFIPPQCYEILARAVIPLQYASKRELYFLLCDSILIDGGGKRFWLERSTAKIGYMLSSRILAIAWGNDQRYWRWVARDDSRFDELAELKFVWWLDIWGEVDCRILSADTVYRVVYVLKANDESYGLDEGAPIKFSVKAPGVEDMEFQTLLPLERRGQHTIASGWIEVVAGEFRVRAAEDIDDDSYEIAFRMKEVRNMKGGLLVDGVRIEPVPT